MVIMQLGSELVGHGATNTNVGSFLGINALLQGLYRNIVLFLMIFYVRPTKVQFLLSLYSKKEMM